jgi:predicted Zn-dependent peptidase
MVKGSYVLGLEDSGSRMSRLAKSELLYGHLMGVDELLHRVDAITAEEVSRGKGMVKGSYVLGLEDSGSRMSRLAKSELLDGDLMSVDELLGRVDAVTPADVDAIAAELLTQPMSLAVVGPFDEAEFGRR